MRGNRETSETSSSNGAQRAKRGGDRSEKAVWPHVGHARLRGVGQAHSTEEADEQSRPEGGGGVRGGKGPDQGKRHA
ncbi:MAG: hypothetical protein KKA28_04665, partial [Planctomycetes bacterium]|nr:hypothetical protein [Planctomycetota bacterium]